MIHAKASSSGSTSLFLFAATMVYLIQFSGLWYWPAEAGTGILESDNTKPLGFFFNVVVYLVTIALLVRHLMVHGVSRLSQALSLFMPLIAWSFVCCLLGFQLSASLRVWTLWSMTFLAGALIGLEVNRSLLVRWFLIYAAFALWASVFWSVAVPSLGSLQGFWRGLFLQKNYLGWIAALTLVTILATPFWRFKVLAFLAGAPAFVCLVLSGAKTALVTVAGVAVYQMLLRVKHRTVESRFISILLLMVVCALIPLYGLDLVLELLGKDPTLTGRTVVWNLYFQKALEHPIVGFGPGAFDGVSDITSSFLQGLEQYGEIRTPHNVYLTFFGDTGIVGVILLVAMLARLTLVRAATDLSYTFRWPALLAFAALVEGMAEALQGFGSNTIWFLLPAAVASAMPQLAEARKRIRRPGLSGRSDGRHRQPAPSSTLVSGRVVP